MANVPARYHLWSNGEGGQRLQDAAAGPVFDKLDLLGCDELARVAVGEDDLGGGGADSGARGEGAAVLGRDVHLRRRALWGRELRFGYGWRCWVIAQGRHRRLGRV